MFLYGQKEPAYRLFFGNVVKAYPLAKTTVIPGESHCSFCFKRPDEYTELLKRVCEESE